MLKLKTIIKMTTILISIYFVQTAFADCKDLYNKIRKMSANVQIQYVATRSDNKWASYGIGSGYLDLKSSLLGEYLESMAFKVYFSDRTLIGGQMFDVNRPDSVKIKITPWILLIESITWGGTIGLSPTCSDGLMWGIEQQPGTVPTMHIFTFREAKAPS